MKSGLNQREGKNKCGLGKQKIVKYAKLVGHIKILLTI